MKHAPFRVGQQALAVACGLWLTGGSLLAAADANPAVATSLQVALTKNIGHARNWLDQADYKSLLQSAGGVQLLASLLQARSDDASWQASYSKIAAAVGELQAAAKAEDKSQCQAAIASLEKQAAAAQDQRPTGQPTAPPRAPAIRPLMLVMDGLYADAKIALVSGNVAAAKNQAAVLAELGGLVSNSRQTDEWRKLAGDYTQAAAVAATTTETDPPAVRQLLRGISQRCEACHETRGR